MRKVIKNMEVFSISLYVYPGVRGLAEVGVWHHRGGELRSVLSRAGQPQALRPGLTPGAAREAPGGSPGAAASSPTTTLACFFGQWV